MSRKDPFSTPARRRRIIAEMAKKTLKFYCIAACENVRTFRFHTGAAIRLQCAIRRFVAQRKVFIIRFERRRLASIKIQTVIRMKLAKLLRKRMEAALLLKRRLRLSEVIHNLRNAQKQRMAWIAMLVARKLAREKKEHSAAVNIQRFFRGMKARKYYRQLHSAHQSFLNKRKHAAIRIQCQARRLSALKRFIYWSTRRKAAIIIFTYVMKWWAKRCRVRLHCSMEIQRIVRGKLGRMRFQVRWHEREHVRELTAQNIIVSAELEVLQDLIMCIARDMVPKEKCMNIHVDIDTCLMQLLVGEGAGQVVQWCLSNSILDYRKGLGYRAGAVVQQVVRSVDQALHTECSHKIDTSVNSAHGTDKVIALNKWDEGEATDVPEESILPYAWGEQVFETAPLLAHDCECEQNNVGMVDGAQLPHVGAGVSAELLSERRLELHITTLQTPQQAQNQHQHGDDSSPFLRNTIVIVFNVPDCDVPVSNPVVTDSATGTATGPYAPPMGNISESAKRGVDELKFRFKNALVYVNSPEPPAVPLVDLEPELNELDIISDCEGGDGEEEEEEEDLELATAVEEVQEVRPRSSTAVVRIVLREPTPSPPPIDYDAKAKIIQVIFILSFLLLFTRLFA